LQCELYLRVAIAMYGPDHLWSEFANILCRTERAIAGDLCRSNNDGPLRIVCAFIQNLAISLWKDRCAMTSELRIAVDDRCAAEVIAFAFNWLTARYTVLSADGLYRL
jgi:hypothetical protein